MDTQRSPPQPPPVRGLWQQFLGGSHLLVSIALGLTLCQLPLLLWLLPASGLHLELQQQFPELGSLLPLLPDVVWLPIALAILIMGICLYWFRRTVLGPLTQIRQQMLQLSDNPFNTVGTIRGSREIEAVADACESLRKQMVQRATEHLKLAYEDGLTGLHNRLRFVMAVDQTLNASLKRVVVIVWSLDRFTSLNTILGFTAGDHLLKALGQRLRQQLTGAVSVARLSNHTFACAFELDEDEAAEAYVNRVLETLHEPVRIYGQPIELSAACGAAISPRDGQAASDLTRRAEIAQNIATGSRLRWLAFQNHFEVQSSARLNMLSELRAALQAQGQLQLHLQPKLNLASGTICEAEALLRWQHPQRGLLFPNEFIPFAEQTGRIHDLTLWALREACRMIEALRSIKPVCISVNISAMDLHEPGLTDMVASLLSERKLDPTLLCLEITESWAMDRPERVLETLDQLHSMGVKLAIDDFGSGYSSMAYMKRFPVHELKIDRSLVAGIKRNSDSETILRCITDLGHQMGLSVTAEGVETLEEYAAVKALGIDAIQGYLIGKAMPMTQFTAFIEQFDGQHLRSILTDTSGRPDNPPHLGG